MYGGKTRKEQGSPLDSYYSFKRYPGIGDGDPEVAIATHCGDHVAIAAIEAGLSCCRGVRHPDQLVRTMHTSVNMSMLFVAAKFPGRLDLPLPCLALRLHAGDSIVRHQSS